jgi:hypothetical protein
MYPNWDFFSLKINHLATLLVSEDESKSGCRHCPENMIAGSVGDIKGLAG